MEKRIRGRVKKQMEKSQRDYYLNEQVKAIQKELGEGEEGDEEEHLPASFPDNPTGDGPLEPKAIEEVVDHDQEAEDKENLLHLAPFYHSRMGMSSPPSTALRTGR